MADGLAARQQDDDTGRDEPEAVSAPAGGWAAAVDADDHGKPPRDRSRRGAKAVGWRERTAAIACRLGRSAAQGARRLLGAVWNALPGPPSEPTATTPAGLPSAPPSLPAVPSLDPDEARHRIEPVLARLPPKGDPSIPANVVVTALLLADDLPVQDFQAVDLLHDAFPRGTRQSDSRVLMAVARNLTRNFGRPGRLPIASAKAWAMLDPALFSDELAAQLAAISSFILGWQAKESSFLILEFSEIELIEYLFENLHPGRHRSLLAQVMDFKVLSARRVGLLRRIPSRIRRVVEQSPAQAHDYLEASLALLTHLSRPENFSAVAMAARIALAEAEKITPPAAPSPPPRPSLHPVMRGLSAPETPAPPPSALPPPAPPSSPPLQSAPISVSVVASPRRPTTTVSVAAAPPPIPVAATEPVRPAKRRRFTKAQKTEAVLRLLQGEAAEGLARSLGIEVRLLENWRDTFLGGGASALVQAPAPTPVPAPVPAPDDSVHDLQDKLKALIQTVEQISARMEQLPPDDKQPGADCQPDLPLVLPQQPKGTPRKRKRKT